MMAPTPEQRIKLESDTRAFVRSVVIDIFHQTLTDAELDHIARSVMLALSLTTLDEHKRQTGDVPR